MRSAKHGPDMVSCHPRGAAEESSVVPEAPTVPLGSELIEAPLGGHIWSIRVRPGDRIEKGAVIASSKR